MAWHPPQPPANRVLDRPPPHDRSQVRRPPVMIGTDRTPRMSRSALVPLAIYYWRESQRPLVSLAFVLPLLVVYEGGVLWLGPAAMRNGADVWLRQLLDL